MASKDTEVTKDHEYYVLSGLLTDSYYLSMVNGEIDDSYFSDRSCKIIYKSLTDFYEKYSKLPSADEMSLSIESNYIDLGVTLEDVKSFLIKIYALTNGAIDEDFMMDKLVELIKKVRLSRTLNKTLEVIKNGNAMNNTRVALDLIDSLNISLKRSNVLALSDVKSLTKAKRDATGTDEQKVIIKSILPSLNQAFQYKGYKFGTLNLIVSPPGCFVGATKIMTLDGGTHSIEELYGKECQGVYGSTKDGRIETAMYDSIYLSKYTKELVDVCINGGKVIRCTPDHPFMLRDGSYKRADSLNENDRLMPVNRFF